MAFWWVNQNQTYRAEIDGGFLWSPKLKKNGDRSVFYDNVSLVRRGDAVFSFCDTRIKAVGVATAGATSAQKPDFGVVGDQWGDEGWLVPIEFHEVSHPVRPKDFIDELRPHLAQKYAPLQGNGSGNQGVYLASVSSEIASLLLAKLELNLDVLFSDSMRSTEDDLEQSTVLRRTDISPTQRRQLILARRGQGVFRASLLRCECACRVTGATNSQFLIASHVKPWSRSSDIEKLDGNNGLLLSPHVDKLFDRGFITFEDSGALLVSSSFDHSLLKSWSIHAPLNVGMFTQRQRSYLDYHRSQIFRP